MQSIASGVELNPDPLIYGPCRSSRLSDYVAYKSARRSGLCLRFLDIEDPTAPQHKMFKEDIETGLRRKLTRREQAADKEQNSGENSPTKDGPNQLDDERAGAPVTNLED